VPGEGDELAERVDRRALERHLEVVRQVAEPVAVRRLGQQDVAVLHVDGGERADQVPHVGADAEILNLARVDADRIGQNGLRGAESWGF
jgi:hypothetical protein